MADLIARKALLDEMESHIYWGDSVVGLLAVAQNAPAVDAVPVVRCGECEHRGNSAFCPLRHLEYTECEGYHYADYTLDDSFCSFGKKKDGGASNG